MRAATAQPTTPFPERCVHPSTPAPTARCADATAPVLLCATACFKLTDSTHVPRHEVVNLDLPPAQHDATHEDLGRDLPLSQPTRAQVKQMLHQV